MAEDREFDIDSALRELVGELHPDLLYELAESLPPEEGQMIIDELAGRNAVLNLPSSPLHQADLLVEGFVRRDHLKYLSSRITQAVRDVEAGKSRKIIVEMPPRSGKSLLATQVTPAWLLASHPTWDVMITSYSRNLATSWGRQIRRWVSDGKLGSHLKVAPDAGAVENWETSEGGKIAARSIGADLTGHGAKVLIIDDPHKNFAEAHSKSSRDRVWNWWLSDVQTRLHPPSLVVVIMTRWHEDDLVGRLLSKETEGDPADWERISFPAIAEKNDVLGRQPGDPLLSPLVSQEDDIAARQRWEDVKRSVGIYTWSALYQQSPAPAEGAIFDLDSIKYWTRDPSLADPLLDGGAINPEAKSVLFDPSEHGGGVWLDSWDASFKGTDSSDYVVGQRWLREGPRRFLVGQSRERLGFTATLARMLAWAKPESLDGTGQYVHKRLIEDKANGPAIINTLSAKLSGLKPIDPRTSKEARARAVTPEIESGHVYIPHPSEPGNEWVVDLLSELRNFPNDAHDDQVDALTQALSELREPDGGGISIPGERSLARSSGRLAPHSISSTRVAGARTLRPRS